MTTYRTGNAIGSADPRDLYDNAENLDELVNSQDKAEHPDRLGVPRKTWYGMEQEHDADQTRRESEFVDAQADKQQRFNLLLANSGYEYLADYAAGIEITEYNQVLRDPAGELWRAAATTTLPYTTDGTGLPEGGAFVAVGDADIRNDLAAGVGAGKGGLLVAGAVIYVNTIADLQALDTSQLVDGQQVRVKEYHAGSDVGGGEFYWDSTRVLESNGVTVLNGWVRLLPESGGIHLSWSGLVSADADGSVEFQAVGDVAYATGMSILLDVDVLLENPVTIKSSITGKGGHIHLNGVVGSAPITIDPDYEEDISDQIQNLPPVLSKGTSYIPELDVSPGDTLTIVSNEVDIRRITNGEVYRKISTHMVSDEGNITPALPFSLDRDKIESLKITRSDPREYKGFEIIISSDLESNREHSVINCRRSLSVFTHLGLVNHSSHHYQVGINVRETFGVTVHKSTLDGFDYPGLGYAVHISWSSHATVDDCDFLRVRKSVDGAYAIHTRIYRSRGVGFGLHWGYDLLISDSDIGSSSDDPCTFFAGEDCVVRGNRLDTTHSGVAFVVRPDSFRMAGTLDVSDNELLGEGAAFIRLRTNQVSTYYPTDYGAALEMPRLLRVRDNVKASGALWVQIHIPTSSLAEGADVIFPKKVEVLDNTSAGTRFQYLMYVGASDPAHLCTFEVSDIYQTTLTSPVNTYGTLKGRNLRENITASAGFLVDSEVYNSAIGYNDVDVERAGEVSPRNIIYFYNSIGNNVSTNDFVRSGHMYYGFVDCRFTRGILAASASSNRVAVARGCQGAAQAFDKNTHYIDISAAP